MRLLAFVLVGLMTVSAYAGPGPVFVPLKSKDQISALKPGDKIAHQCPMCGTMAVSTVEEKGKLEHLSCPECKMKLTIKEVGSGKGGKIPETVCVDEKGKEMAMAICVEKK